jgi:hypothetical protein
VSFIPVSCSIKHFCKSKTTKSAYIGVCPDFITLEEHTHIRVKRKTGGLRLGFVDMAASVTLASLKAEKTNGSGKKRFYRSE